jgi:hypothetical protein
MHCARGCPVWRACEHRRLLLGVAYRIIGSVADTQDAVRDA